MLDKRLLKKIDLFYKLAKMTVLPSSNYVLPGSSIFYSDEGESPIVEGIISTEESIPNLDPIRPGFRKDLSPIEEYRSYFSGTDIPYHVIFTNNKFDTYPSKGVDGPTPINDFKNILQVFLEKYSIFGSGESELPPSFPMTLPQAYEEAKYLLDNWDKLFSNAENSITILANEYESSDFKNPEAIDHDLGHKISQEVINNYNYSLFDNSLKTELFDAANKEFVAKRMIGESESINSSEKDISLNQLFNLLYKKTDYLNILLFTTIYNNDLLPKSISSTNIPKSDFSDLIADLLPYFRVKGGLSKILDASSPIDLYYKNNEFKSSPFFIIESSYKITPKPGFEDIPETKKVMKKILSDFDQKFVEKLNKLKGKIINLWDD